MRKHRRGLTTAIGLLIMTMGLVPATFILNIKKLINQQEISCLATMMNKNRQEKINQNKERMAMMTSSFKRNTTIDSDTKINYSNRCEREDITVGMRKIPVKRVNQRNRLQLLEKLPTNRSKNKEKNQGAFGR